MNAIFYLEINVFGLFLLTLMFFNLRKTTGMMPDDILFRAMILAIGGVLVADAVGWLADGKAFCGAGCVLRVSNAVYFSLSALANYLWMQYADFRLNEDIAALRRRKHYYMMPLLVLLAMSAASPWTGWLFSIDNANFYRRGSLFFVNAALSWLMLGYTMVLAAMRFFTSRAKAKRSECLLIMQFVLVPLLASLLQAAYYGLALIWISTCCSLLVIFVGLQNRQISLDGLTGINNRRTLNRFLETKSSELRPFEKMYLILLDVDGFKSINDTYGHAAGDAVLISAAGILKSVCGAHNTFLARYGGDEFAIVCVSETPELAERVIAAVREEVRAGASCGVIPVAFSFSMGYAELQGGAGAVERLIVEADEQMYRVKKQSGTRRG